MLNSQLKPFREPPNLLTQSPSVRVGSVYRIAITGATAGLLFGFDTAVINGALLSLRAYFGLSGVQVEFAASSLLYGCLLGAMIAGALSDRFGRRAVLRLSGATFLLSAIFTAISATFFQFMLMRFLGGLGIGFASTVAPLYLAEISPRERRGSIITLNQIAIVSGILLAYCTNWALAKNGVTAWRWMFGSAAIPSLGFILCLRLVPESPRWLIQRHRFPDAESALCQIGEANPAQHLEEIRLAIAEERPEPGWIFRMRRPLLLAIGIAALQQLTGINTVLYYGSLLFASQGNSGSDQRAFGANVLLGMTNLLFTFAALAIMDRIGRRHLLAGSVGVMGLALLLLVFAFHHAHPVFPLVVCSTMLYVAAFATGLGPAAWVYMAEIFPTNIRGRAMSIATSVLWLSCILISNSFLTLLRVLGASRTFGVYAGMCAVAFFFFLRLPETRGMSLEKIERSWNSDV